MNPNADFPTQSHVPTNVGAFSGQPLGGTTPNQTDLAGKVEEELKALGDKLGPKASTPTLDALLLGRDSGQTEWQNIDSIISLRGAGSGGANSPMPAFTQYDSLDSGFTDFYGNGTISHATDDFVDGTASLKLVTLTDNSRTGAQKVIGGDWSGKAFKLWVKSSNWNVVSDVSVLVSTSGDFASLWQCDINAKRVNVNNNEWTEITLTRSDFENGGGSPSWATVNKIMFRARATNGNSTTVWFDGFGVFDDGAEGFVSITFDDGYASTFTQGKSYMDKYGFRGTSFPVPDFVGTTSYMTQSQVDLLHEGGWDIAGHAEGSLGLDTQAQRIAKILTAKKYCRDRGYRGQDIFAWPSGVFSRTIMQDVQKYFAYQRGLETWSNPTSHFVPTQITAKNVTNATSTATIQGWIDNAIADKSWLVLSFHAIVTTPGGAIEYSIANFQTIIDYLAAEGIKVLPMSEVIRRL